MRIFFRKVGELLLCVCIGYLLFEGYVLFIKPPPPSELVQRIPSQDFYRYKPYMNFGEDPFATTYPFVLSADAALNIKEEKPANTLRVVIAGNSVAASSALNKQRQPSALFSPPGYWPKRIKDQIDASLNKNSVFASSEVVSAGGQAYNTSNDLIKYIFLTSRYSPDVVIFLDFYVDLYGTLLLGIRPGVDTVSPGIEARIDHPFLLEAFRLTEGALPTLNRMISKLIEQKLEKKANRNIELNQLADAIVRNYVAADAFSRGISAKFLVVLQPIASLHAHPGAGGNISEIGIRFRKVRDLVKKGLSDRQVAFVDMTELFNDPDWKSDWPFMDEAHFYDQGYIFFCDRLASDIFHLLKSERPTLHGQMFP
jgi:hypothetical protein